MGPIALKGEVCENVLKPGFSDGAPLSKVIKSH